MNGQIMLTGSIAAYFFIALYNTFSKEKLMIEEGGEPLPTSSYMFLIIKYLLWAIVTWYGSLVIPEAWKAWEGIKFFFLSVSYMIIAYLVATLLEVIIRVVVIYIAHKRESIKGEEG